MGDAWAEKFCIVKLNHSEINSVLYRSDITLQGCIIIIILGLHTFGTNLPNLIKIMNPCEICEISEEQCSKPCKLEQLRTTLNNLYVFASFLTLRLSLRQHNSETHKNKLRIVYTFSAKLSNLFHYNHIERNAFGEESFVLPFP